MKSKLPRAEMRTDLEAVSVGGSNGHGPTDDLAREILEERRNRLQRQNKKLDFEIQRHEQQLVDFGQIQRQVLRCNEVVKQSLYAMIRRVSAQLAVLDDPHAIEDVLDAELRQCFNDLAFEHGARSEPRDD